MFLFGANNSKDDDDSNLDNYRHIFFAGFPSSSAKDEKLEATATSTAADCENEEEDDENKKQNSKNPVNDDDNLLRYKTTTTNNKSKSSSSLNSIVRELFDPYGNINFFSYDSISGVGFVEFAHGKSGETCYLMSHLLPFRLEREEEEQEQRQKFSLICLEFACLLPFSPTSHLLFDDPLSWACTRNGLGKDKFASCSDYHNNSSSSLLAVTSWRKHLEFMESQKMQKKLYWGIIKEFRKELLLFSSDNSNNNNNSNKKKGRISAELSADLLSEVEKHMFSLVTQLPLLKKQTAKQEKEEEEEEQEKEISRWITERVERMAQTKFWQESLIPFCMNKVLSQICEIDVDESVLDSPVARKRKQQQKQQQEQEEEEEKEEPRKEQDPVEKFVLVEQLKKRKRVQELLRSVVHSSLSILDVWKIVFSEFYSATSKNNNSVVASTAGKSEDGNYMDAKTMYAKHGSAVALLESKLLLAPTEQEERANSAAAAAAASTSAVTAAASSNNNSGNTPAALVPSLRHPAWVAHTISHTPLGGSKSASSASSSSATFSMSPAIQRRTEFLRLFQSQIQPIHLGLKEWPGGAGDDAGSSIRALFTLLLAFRPLYQDTTLRHVWFSLCSPPPAKPSSLLSSSSSSSSYFKYNPYSQKPYLDRFEKCESQIKKHFNNSSPEHLLDGAWNVLYRGCWRMESAFALVVAYFQEKERSMHDLVDSGETAKSNKIKNSNRKNNNKNSSEDAKDGKGNNNNDEGEEEKREQEQEEEEEEEKETPFQILRAIDGQPSLWPLCRPVDSSEIDWQRTQGLFPDAAKVFTHLFDEDENKKKKKPKNCDADADEIDPQKNPFYFLLHIWYQFMKKLIYACALLLLSLLGHGHHSDAILSSPRYRRHIFGAPASFLVPIFWCVVLAVFFLILLRSETAAEIQSRFYSLVSTGNVEGIISNLFSPSSSWTNDAKRQQR